MIKKEEMLVGTKEELAEHIETLVDYPKEHRTENNLLYDKDGFIKQMDAFPFLKNDRGILNKNRFGYVYYLNYTKNGDEVILALKDKYVKVLKG